MQHAMQHAAYAMQHATRNMGDAACNMQHILIGQRTAYTTKRATRRARQARYRATATHGPTARRISLQTRLALPSRAFQPRELIAQPLVLGLQSPRLTRCQAAPCPVRETHPSSAPGGSHLPRHAHAAHHTVLAQTWLRASGRIVRCPRHGTARHGTRGACTLAPNGRNA